MSDTASLLSFRATMSDLQASLARVLGLDLKYDAKPGAKGLEGRVYMENPHFNFQYSLVKVQLRTETGGARAYYVQLRTGLLPKVNNFAKFFPFTRSRSTVVGVIEAVKESIRTSEPRSAGVAINLDDDVSRDVSLLVAAQGGAMAILGTILGYLASDTSIGALEGAAVGAVVGVASIVFLVFRAFD